MRGRKNIRCTEWRSRKRAALQVLLLAAAPMWVVPAMADSPVATSQFVLPPLPLAGQAKSVSSGPTINPFCQPAPAATATASRELVATPSLGVPRPVTNQYFQLPPAAVQLASGDAMEAQETTLRLMPLESQPEGQAINNGVVRANPLAVTEPVDEASKSFAMPTAKPAQDESKSVAATEPVTKAAALKEGPVSFSLDDETLVDTSSRTSEPTARKSSLASLMHTQLPQGQAADAPQAVSPVNRSPAHRPPLNSAINEPLAKGSFQFGKAKSPSRELDPSSAIHKGSSAGRTLLVPLPSADHSVPVVALRDHDARANSGTPRAKDARLVKGARPRVDVGVPPVAIERMTLGHPVASAPVAHVAPLQPARPLIDPEFQSEPSATLEMKRAEVRSLKLASEIRQVRVSDSTICAAIAAGPSQIQLIGTGDGVTRLAVWTAAADGKQTKDVYEIRVGSPGQSDASDPAHIAGTLTRSAQAAFPMATVQVHHDAGQMIVEGSCPTEASAKQVLRMIRSACLLPVVDKISVR